MWTVRVGGGGGGFTFDKHAQTPIIKLIKKTLMMMTLMINPILSVVWIYEV